MISGFKLGLQTTLLLLKHKMLKQNEAKFMPFGSDYTGNRAMYEATSTAVDRN